MLPAPVNEAPDTTGQPDQLWGTSVKLLVMQGGVFGIKMALQHSLTALMKSWLTTNLIAHEAAYCSGS